MARRPILSAIGLLALAGCTVGPNYRRPEVALPASYANSSGPGAGATASTQSPATLAWWRGFGDPGLTEAVERALAQNLDIVAARARIVQARAAGSAAGAALLPTVNLQAAAGQDQQSLLDPFGVVARQVPGFERQYPLLSFGAAASWEIDLFGGLRRSREAARADMQASLDDLHAVQLSVAAETADAYLQLRDATARSTLAERRLAVEARVVDLLTQARTDGGASERELIQARALRDALRANLAPIKAAEAAQGARLAVLMGSAPGSEPQVSTVSDALPRPLALDTLGTPADLLRRRPDVLAAERRLASANARIGASISDYYPKISLSGLLGVESREPDLVFVGDAMQHQITGAVRWRLFDFGRVDAEVAQARGRTAEALAAYRQAVFKATGEVETALSEVEEARVQAQALNDQVEDLRRALDQAQAANRQGGASRLAVLTAERDLLSASDSLSLARAAELRSDVEVSRATGGG